MRNRQRLDQVLDKLSDESFQLLKQRAEELQTHEMALQTASKHSLADAFLASVEQFSRPLGGKGYVNRDELYER